MKCETKCEVTFINFLLETLILEWCFRTLLGQNRLFGLCSPLTKVTLIIYIAIEILAIWENILNLSLKFTILNK